MTKMNRLGSSKHRRSPVRLFLLLLAFAVSTISLAAARAELLYVTLDNKTVMSYDISLATAADIQNSAQTFLDLSNLSLPVGLAFDSASNVYVGDFLGNTISKYSFSGSLLATISTNLTNPLGIAIDAAGNLYAANPGGSVSKFAPSGSFLSAISTSVPQDVAFDSSGNIYISNGSPTNTVSKYDSAGVFLATISGNMDNPYGLALDSSNNLYVANLNTNVSVFNSSGTFVSALSPTSVNARANDVLVDTAGNIYVTNYFANAISKFDAAGNYQFSWSTPDAPRFLAVPEPSTYAMSLTGLGFAGYSMFRRRKRA